MEFVIQETGRKIKSINRPLTLITSNNEKELPAAFLRRCIFHYIDFPEPAFMADIVASHFPKIESSLLKRALESFYVIRTMDDMKKSRALANY